MATVKGNISDEGTNVRVVEWSNMAGGDTGEAVQVAQFNDKTVQAVGDATSVALQGSNDGASWFALTDANGSTIALGAASNDMKLVRENPRYIRPSVTGGTATDVIVVAVM